LPRDGSGRGPLPRGVLSRPAARGHGKPAVSPRRLVTALAVLLLFVVLAAVHQYNSPRARFLRYCHHLQTPSGRGADKPVTDGNPTVAVLGDSYSSGFALQQPTEAWPTQLGRIEHWRVFVDGVAGTGMTNSGLCDQPYASRVQQVLSYRAQRVIIEVGLNDTASPELAIQQATSAVLARLSAVAQVDVVGPPPVPAKSPAYLQRTDTALRTATQQAGRRYVGALGWQLPYLPDGVHLTPVGHRQFAELVALALRG